ncbi:Hypothetical protein CINCED_3A003671 [Cinara cedri]|uniref:Uncharacterized protein n=1 Tax=Cinara cedri TaxID=506608 RepID=A0A5E4NJV2_9HEMI|nr:Hypothetical protein CINCED_3A003671 [Cinara cedri]
MSRVPGLPTNVDGHLRVFDKPETSVVRIFYCLRDTRALERTTCFRELKKEVQDLKKSLTEVGSLTEVKNGLELAFYSDDIRVSENAPWFESCLKIVQDALTMLNNPQFYSISFSLDRVFSFKENIINSISSEPIDIIGFTHNVTIFISLAVSSKVSDTQKLLKKRTEVGKIAIQILKAWNAEKNANEYIKRLVNTVNHIESIVALEENGSLNVNGEFINERIDGFMNESSTE